MKSLAKPPFVLDDGDPAPDFDLPRPTTDANETYRLSAAAREGPVVLAFYPVADAAGAAAMLRELAAVDWTAVTDSLAILGVGVGDRESYELLAEKVEAPFPLLLDRDGFFADRYGVLDHIGDGAVRVRRALFVVGEDCFVRYAWSDADSTGTREGALPLEAIQSAVESR